ncbi:MAG: hypothetical protein HKN87_20135 [Saprospiraceae bacterium]|nr:hypothetical protein [Saprospiraceae bacterium]
MTRAAWGIHLNGKTYSEEALITQSGWQYSTYYDKERYLSVARRMLPDGGWQKARLDYHNTTDDNHNVASIGICPIDGTIHLAYDHHGDELHYQKSIQGVTLNPESIAWDIHLFTGNLGSLPGSGSMSSLEKVTYPRFVIARDGALFLFWRNGGSRNGRIWMSEYSPKSKWKDQWQISSSTGNYSFGGTTSNNRNMYLNGIQSDTSGKLHISWCWREEDGGLGDHSINYACSEDRGLTWKNYKGVEIANQANDKRIDISSPDICIWQVDPGRGLQNQNCQVVDSKGRIHIGSLHLQEGVMSLDVGTRDYSKSALYDYWLDESGKWHRAMITTKVDTSLRYKHNRPQFIVDSEDNVYCIWNYNFDLLIAVAKRSENYRTWTELIHESGPFTSEFPPDHYRMMQDNIISIFAQDKPSQDGQNSAVRVIDYRIEGLWK